MSPNRDSRTHGRVLAILFVFGTVSANSSELDEAEGGFGLTRAEAIEVCEPEGERAYLERLRCPDGKGPSFERAGSVGVRNPIPDEEAEKKAMAQMFDRARLSPSEVDDHMLDRYLVTCSDRTVSLYLDMYHCRQPPPDEAPPGFTIRGKREAKRHVKEQVRDILASLAEEVVGDGRKEIRTFHFRVITNVDKKVAISIAENLEVIYSTLDRELWPEGTLLPPYETSKIRVYVFETRKEYETVCALEGCQQTSGQYLLGTGLLMFCMDTDFKEVLHTILIHETVHAYLDSRVAHLGVDLPRWLHEGLAHYAGYSRLRRGEFQLGVFCNKTFYRSRFSGTVDDSLAREALRVLKKTVRKQPDDPLVPELLDSHWASWHDRETALPLYERAFLFVTYLRDGKPGWRMDRFPRFILGLSSGEFIDEHLLEVYGRSPAEIDRDFKDWVAKYRLQSCR